MKTAVDSNVLLDILLDDPSFAEGSQRALTAATLDGQVVICPVVYAEVAAYFDDAQNLEGFLHDYTVRGDQFEPEALRQAARAWKAYTRDRGRQIQCRHCGHKSELTCPACHRPISWRQYPLPDFLVGGHAAIQADALLTRDRGYYRAYFPKLKLLVPVPTGSQPA